MCDNNSIHKLDQFGKIGGFIELFCQKLKQFKMFSECLSIGGEMIPCTGKHAEKTYMRRKHIKIGYKLCVPASSGGYPFNLQVYVGKKNNIPPGTWVILDFIDWTENPRKARSLY